MAIRSFTTQDEGDTENCFWGAPVSRKCPWQAVYESARDALIYLHAARDLKALRTVPGYRLELLGSHGKKQNKRLAGFYSIRINNRWRLVFRWTEQNAVSMQVASDAEETDVGEDKGLEAALVQPGSSDEPNASQEASAATVSDKGEAAADEIVGQATEDIGGQADEVEIIDYH